MINDANFSSSFDAWRAHDRNLRTSFFNTHFMLDIDSMSYVKGFNWEWLASQVSSFWKECSKSPLDSCSFQNSSSQNHPCILNSNIADSSSSHYSPYNCQEWVF